jgi:archaellum component FlaG (FlaF/FlaG flagellin family)
MDMMVTLLNDMSGKIASDMHDKTTLVDAFTHLSVMMKEGANIITNRMNRVKEARMAEKGYGIYVDNAGRTYSVLDNDLEEVIKKDREATKEALEDNK